jgi:cell division protein FtsL
MNNLTEEQPEQKFNKEKFNKLVKNDLISIAKLTLRLSFVFFGSSVVAIELYTLMAKLPFGFLFASVLSALIVSFFYAAIVVYSAKKGMIFVKKGGMSESI